jgi:hypothetical protein
VTTCVDTHDQNCVQSRSPATVGAWLPWRCQALLQPQDRRAMQPQVRAPEHQAEHDLNATLLIVYRSTLGRRSRNYFVTLMLTHLWLCRHCWQATGTTTHLKEACERCRPGGSATRSIHYGASGPGRSRWCARPREASAHTQSPASSSSEPGDCALLGAARCQAPGRTGGLGRIGGNRPDSGRRLHSACCICAGRWWRRYDTRRTVSQEGLCNAETACKCGNAYIVCTCVSQHCTINCVCRALPHTILWLVSVVVCL